MAIAVGEWAKRNKVMTFREFQKEVNSVALDCDMPRETVEKLRLILTVSMADYFRELETRLGALEQIFMENGRKNKDQVV